MTTMTPELAQQTALMAQLEVMREEMARELERQKALSSEMEQRLRDGVPEAADSLSIALREFRKDREVDDPNNRMNRPCAHVKDDGSMCGVRWRTDGQITHPIDHSYRPNALKSTDATKGKQYVFTKNDLVDYGLPPEAPTVAPAEVYCTEQQAAEMLGATVPQVRKMTRSGTIGKDQIGTVVLLHRADVLRIVALKEAAELASPTIDVAS